MITNQWSSALFCPQTTVFGIVAWMDKESAYPLTGSDL
jgi:hypothetical protein